MGGWTDRSAAGETGPGSAGRDSLADSFQRTIETFAAARWRSAFFRTLIEREWDEEKHPRDARGRFAVTDSPAFREWFKDSKVVDDSGKPLVVYHATAAPADFAEFDPARIGENTTLKWQAVGALGFWFVGGPYAAQGVSLGVQRDEHGRVLPVYLSIQHPYVVREIRGKWDSPLRTEGRVDPLVVLRRELQAAGGTQQFKDWLTKRGYDGIKIVCAYDAGLEGLDQYVAFRPEQIKSVFNRGTFNPKSAKISEAFDPNQPRDEHGRWTAGVSSAIAALEQHVRQPQSRVERTIVLNVLTGEKLHDAMHGHVGEDNTDRFVDMMVQQRPDNSLVVLHTHPDSSTFSDGDWVTFRSHDVAELYVITKGKGTWKLAKTPEYEAGDWQERTPRRVRERWNAIAEELLPTHDADETIFLTNQRLATELHARFERVDARGKREAFDPNQPRDERGRWTSSAAFKAWFGQSKVVDDSGKPLVVYHGTRSEGFEAFAKTKDIGFHFGTVEQANDPRFVGEDMFGGSMGARWSAPPQVMPVYLSIDHPLHMRDLNTWSPQIITEELRRIAATGDEPRLTSAVVGQIEEARSEAFWDHTKRGSEAGLRRAAELGVIRRHLEQLGYDGIRYGNEGEGVRVAPSWIAFHPHQIKSIWNRGTFNPKSAKISESFDPAEHPRHPAGSPEGGEFAPKGGGIEGPVGEWIERFRQDFAHAKIENCVIVTPTGTLVKAKAGGATSIPMEPKEVAALRDLVLVHNHPSGCSLSIEDMWTAITADMEGMYVVGVSKIDGTPRIYGISRPEGGWPKIDPHDRQKFRDLAEKYQADAGWGMYELEKVRKDLTYQQMNELSVHYTASMVSKELKIPYRRIGPPIIPPGELADFMRKQGWLLEAHRRKRIRDGINEDGSIELDKSFEDLLIPDDGDVRTIESWRERLREVWDEEKHPRDERGRWTIGSGSMGMPSTWVDPTARMFGTAPLAPVHALPPQAVPVPVAPPAAARLEAFTRSHWRDSVEHLISITPDGARVLELVGEEHMVPISVEQQRELKDAVVAHNHGPDAGWGFSPDDLMFAIHCDARAIQVVTQRYQDGTRAFYEIQRPTKGWGDRLSGDLWQRYKRYSSAVREVLQKEIDGGRLLPWQAFELHNHNVMRQLCAEVGFPYRREGTPMVFEKFSREHARELRLVVEADRPADDSDDCPGPEPDGTWILDKTLRTPLFRPAREKGNGHWKEAEFDPAEHPRHPAGSPDGGKFAPKGAGSVDSPAFKEWFGNSKVVDDAGNPLRLYHGTQQDWAEVDLGRSVRGYGDRLFFLTPDPELASEYAMEHSAEQRAAKEEMADASDAFEAVTQEVREKGGASPWFDFERTNALLSAMNALLDEKRITRADYDRWSAAEDRLYDANQRLDKAYPFNEEPFPTGAAVMPMYAAIENPHIVDVAGFGESATWDLLLPLIIRNMREKGHDGAIIKNVRDAPTEEGMQRPNTIVIATRPEQIKSAYNRGTWSRHSAKISEADFDPAEHPREPKGTPEGGQFAPKLRGVGEDIDPMEPGTRPIKPGYLRLYHYVGKWEEGQHPDDILTDMAEHGILQQRAKGETYGEPNVVWASYEKPRDGKSFVEFQIAPDDESMVLGNVPAYRDKDGVLRKRWAPGHGEPWTQADADEWNKSMSNVAFNRDIRPDEFVAVHQSWHYNMRELANDPTDATKFAQEVKGYFDRGDYDRWVNDPRYDRMFAWMERRWGKRPGIKREALPWRSAFFREVWDEEQHPRGKTSPESTPGSFAPAGGASSSWRDEYAKALTSAPGRSTVVPAGAAYVLATTEDKIRNKPVENMLLVGKNGVVLHEATGNGNQVNFSLTDEQIEQARGGVMTHNHPVLPPAAPLASNQTAFGPPAINVAYHSGCGLGPGDLFAMIKLEVGEIRCVAQYLGIEGERYEVTYSMRAPEGGWTEAHRMNAKKVIDEIRGRYANDTYWDRWVKETQDAGEPIDRPTYRNAEIWRTIVHEFNEEFAARTGAHYTRTVKLRPFLPGREAQVSHAGH